MNKNLFFAGSLVLALSTAIFPHSSGAATVESVVVDAVVATVDEKPITLVELGRRLSPPRKLSLSDASTSKDARDALDMLIFENLVFAEAERRNIRVSDEEVDKYVSEVTQRNSLSPESFEQALKHENKTLQEYKEQIKLEILKSKIAGSYIRTTAAVTDEDVENFIKDNSSHTSSEPTGNQVELEQILLSHDKYTSEQAKEVFNTISQAMADGASFEDMAKKYSDSSDAAEGGSLGIVSEKDLSPEIFDAVLNLGKGETSKVISTVAGYHLFKLVRRIEQKDASEEGDNNKVEVSDALRAQVRQRLEKEKLQSKMANFFESELVKLHTVDKKI